MRTESHSILSRPLLLGWTLWLLVSWLIHMTVNSPADWLGHGSVPALRGLLISALSGIVLIWPALRLAQGPGDHVHRRTLGDLLVLCLIFEIMLTMLLANNTVRTGPTDPHWSSDQVFWMGAVVAVWTLPVGGCIAWGSGMGALGRSIMVALAALLSVAGLLVTAGGGPVGALYACPYILLWRLVERTSLPGHTCLIHCAAVAAAGAVGWIVVAVATWPRQQRPTTMHRPADPLFTRDSQ